MKYLKKHRDETQKQKIKKWNLNFFSTLIINQKKGTASSPLNLLISS
jgi:hypothetical protein